MPTVRIVVPHFGSNELLDKCMAAVRAQEMVPGVRVEVRVYDSNPPHPQRLFTEACNLGIADGGFPTEGYVWLLNNDCFPRPGCMRAALSCFAEPGCGLVGCQNRSEADPDRIVWGGSLACYPAGIHKAGRASLGQLQTRTEENWATFASVLIDVRMMQEIGLLDRNLRHVFSDSDYCLRAKAAGWRIFHEPAAVVLHRGGSSANQAGQPGWLQRVMDEDRKVFHRKWFKGYLNLEEKAATLPPERRDNG